jgi:hypothetical protein
METLKDHVTCLLCNKEFKGISRTHLLHKHGISLDDYLNKFPGVQIRSDKALAAMTEKMTGREVTWNDKMSIAAKKAYKENPEGWGRTGSLASDETKKKMSDALMGRVMSPESRIKNSITMQTRHISKTDPERWKQIVEVQTQTRIANGTDNRSKSERYAFKYISKYFSIFHNIIVVASTSDPLPEGKKAFTVDMSIPEYKIAIEFDGLWHREIVIKNSEETFYKKVFADVAKNEAIAKNGWKIVRIEYGNFKHENQMKSECRRLCREAIRTKLLPLIEDKKFYESFKNDRTLSYDRLQEIKAEYRLFKENKKKMSEEQLPKNDFESLFD